MSAIFIYKNTRIHYTSEGKGAVIVLLHGFLENIGMWKKIIPVLSQKNRVIAIDLLGHGQSENLGYVHTMEQQAEMVKAVLNSLKLRKYILIGHSMGGYVALAFVDLFPNSIKGLCLLNSTAYPDSVEKKINRDRAILVVKQNHQMFIRVSIPQLFSKENRILLKSEIENVIEDCLKTSKQGIIASLEGMKIRKDHTAILRGSGFKKTMILGADDTVLDYDKHALQVLNTTVDVVKLPHGHMSHVEAVGTLEKSLIAFLTST